MYIPLVFKLPVLCRAVGCVSGLRDAALPAVLGGSISSY